MITLESLRALLRHDTSYDAVERAFTQPGQYGIYGLSSTQKAFWLHAMRGDIDAPVIIVTHNRERKEQWERDLAFLAPHVPQYSFPVADKISFATTAKTLEIQAKMMRALARLTRGKACFVVATVEEAAQRLIAPELLVEHIVPMRVGDTLARDTLLETLIRLGYERTDQVESRGQFAVRGDIVDIFTVNREHPVRLEFFGDEIDTIRTFTVDTQRSQEQLLDCVVLPLKVEGPEDASLLSYGGDGLVLLDEQTRLQEALKGYLHEKEEHLASHWNWRHWMETKRAKTTAYLDFLQKKVPYVTLQAQTGLSAKGMTSFERQMPIFVEEVQHWQASQRAIMVVIQNRQRRDGIIMALEREHIPYQVVSEGPVELQPGMLYLVEGLLTDGFEFLYAGFVVVTEGNIFGQQKKALRRKKESKGQDILYFTDLTPGDYVVHEINGIGKYVGVKTIETDGISRDYIEIEYAGTDKLFLPTDKLTQLQKYIGNEGETPKLHRMGGVEWRKATTKAKKSIDDLAEKLVQLYAEREIVEGFAFAPDDLWQREFEDAFPYEETPDQLQAVAEIKESMESPRPMDRLLCGDVGFGKTEVAMRAAFKAVMSGKQVAVLVPTTILAQQHLQTFQQRFAPFSVRVAVLNRFCSTADKKAVISGVQEGSIDILIGTHSLLSKQITFKNLGLLIVDEEQRFGVAQKEKRKEWAKAIDVLTLSATPIPRTLHMSLVGVREMSVINTPPAERLPVQTYVAEYDLTLVKEAIRRELSRGGQVFFVYNRVQGIYELGERLAEAMPDLRYCVAHGQMSGPEMESIMIDFYEGKYDVLVSTSIVENGIDVPNANTIIVYDADKLGLSQLYQMRGRVGRSSKRAYAYFLYRPDKILTEQAEKRLRAMKDFTELGSGFKVAMRDLEIRGAGSLLGSKQHGNIASIGFAMYCHLLEKAIAKAQNREVVEDTSFEVSIQLKVNAYLDDSYISDSGRKISMYQKLLRAHSKEEVDGFVEELIDRFGTPTDAVDNLIQLAYIRERARALGIQTLSLTPIGLEITWGDDSKMANWDMGSVRQDLWKRMQFGKQKPTQLRIACTDSDRNRIIPFVKMILTELEKKEVPSA